MISELYIEHFKSKRVTVMGLGLLGRGVGDTAFLVECGADIIVTDMKSQEELHTSVELLKDYKDITYHLGSHMLSDFEKRDYILKAAGVPYDSEYIEYAKKNSIPVYMSAALVSDIVMKHDMGVTIIGVTGTRGKSTVTQLIAHILRVSGHTVHVGGNIRGVANLPLLKEVEEGNFLVLELDSWQLQGFGDMKISPHIAVFTSFMDDHMNYYKNDKELYFHDKSNIYRNQTEYDVLIASPQAASEILMREKVAIMIPDKLHFEMSLIGEHNQVAAQLAYEAVSQCGVQEEDIRAAIASFSPVEGRLEYMGLYRGIRVFNDNNATTQDATIAALLAINDTYQVKPIIIVGGKDKGLDVSSLEQELLVSAKTCVFLKGSGTDTLNLPQTHLFSTLAQCVEYAFSIIEEGDIILFSPAFASFSDEFKNEYERNDAFVKEVNKYL